MSIHQRVLRLLWQRRLVREASVFRHQLQSDSGQVASRRGVLYTHTVEAAVPELEVTAVYPQGKSGRSALGRGG
jgi:hypothetical protein